MEHIYLAVHADMLSSASEWYEMTHEVGLVATAINRVHTHKCVQKRYHDAWSKVYWDDKREGCTHTSHQGWNVGQEAFSCQSATLQCCQGAHLAAALLAYPESQGRSKVLKDAGNVLLFFMNPILRPLPEQQSMLTPTQGFSLISHSNQFEPKASRDLPVTMLR